MQACDIAAELPENMAVYGDRDPPPESSFPCDAEEFIGISRAPC